MFQDNRGVSGGKPQGGPGVSLSSPRLVTIDTMASRKRKSKSSDDDHHSKRRQESSSSWPPTSFLECSHCWDDDNNDTASSSVAINNAAATYGTCDNVSTRYQKICRVGEGTYGVVYRAFDRYHQPNPRNRQPLSTSSSDRGKKNVNAEKNNDDDDYDDGIVALKRCLPHNETTDGFPLTTIREITILNDLRRSMSSRRDGGAAEEHYFITLLDVTVSSSRSGVFLVFNYVPHTLASIIDTHNHNQPSSSTNHQYSGSSSNNNDNQHSGKRRSSSSPFNEGEIKQLMLQLLHALHYLHTHYIIHRDIKTSNLLYDDRVGLLRVADFGLARRVGRMECPRHLRGNNSGGSSSRSSYLQHQCILTPKVISLWSRPPEILLGAEHYFTSVDTWGAGCVMGELLLGRPLMDGKDEYDQIGKIFTFLGPPNSNDWPEMLDLPLFKSGTIEIPKQQQSWVNNNSSSSSNVGLHMLDVFHNWECPSGIKLLLGLLKYNPSLRYTANEAMCNTDYFSTSVPPTPTIPSCMPKFPTNNNDTYKK